MDTNIQVLIGHLFSDSAPSLLLYKATHIWEGFPLNYVVRLWGFADSATRVLMKLGTDVE